MWKSLPPSQLISRLFESSRSQGIVRPRVILAMPPTSTWLPPPVNRPTPGAHASGTVTVTEKLWPAPSPDGQGVTAVAVTAIELPPGDGRDPLMVLPLA